VQADVTKEADVEAMVDKAVSVFGRLDTFNNAGFGTVPKPLHEQSVEDFDMMALTCGACSSA